MDIVDYIPIGSQNAISRQSLCIITGMSDRKVRKSNIPGEKKYVYM